MAMSRSEKYQSTTTATTTTTTTTTGSKNDRSVFVMVAFASEKAVFDRGILYEFKIKEGGQIIINGIEHKGTLGGFFNIALYNTLAEFSKGDDSFFRCARFGSSSKLFIFHDKFDRGLIFDTTTTQTMSISSSSLGCGSFTRPTKHNTEAPLISAYGNLYYLADRLSRPYSTDATTFQRYNPNTDSWDNLPPCPIYSIDWGKFNTIGFAVSSGCILFSLELPVWNQFDFLVYHIGTQSWHKVSKPVDDYSRYLPFPGRAVVVDDHTIYAASYTTGYMLVLKFSLHVPPNPVDGPYFIDSFTVLSGLEVVAPPQSYLCRIGTYYMVHLGDFDFCLVYNYDNDLYRQNLCITTFRIVSGSSSSSMQQHIETLYSTVADFYLQPNNYNHIVFSFTPDYDDDDDTQSQEDKSATTVKPAKYKSVCAFNAKEGTAKKMRRVEGMSHKQLHHIRIL